jgi:trehalose synthase
MDPLEEVSIAAAPLERFIPIVGEGPVREALAYAARFRDGGEARTVWNVNSTGAGGGVAELLRSLLAYSRGAGIDARWLVIRGSPDFFRLTKRLHNAIHGEPGDGSPLAGAERDIFEATLRPNAAALLERVHSRDVVILHDPQTAGLAPALLRTGARIIWRCHIGTETRNAQTELGWRFLMPYLREVRAIVFSRAAFRPPPIEADRTHIVPPSIDPFSAKNRDMDGAEVQAILAFVGLLQGSPPPGPPRFARCDGSPATVEHLADVLQLGPPPRADAPLVVQVSRWDALNDPSGVMRGFVRAARNGLRQDAELVLAGPNVTAVADDPDGPAIFQALSTEWRALPHEMRQRVHLASLPMHDVDENGAIVNALQRHAAVVVQKSLREGFGLTVTEAMWKSRPVIASAVGGIQDQIEDGKSGLLLRDPADLGGFADALVRLLADAELARALGERARRRVIEKFLGVRHLIEYGQIIERLDAEAPAS